MDSGNDGGTLGTTAGSDCCCCWHDMLAQNQKKIEGIHFLVLNLWKSGAILINQ